LKKGVSVSSIFFTVFYTPFIRNFVIPFIKKEKKVAVLPNFSELQECPDIHSAVL
jgi:hypothetical protein